LNKDITILFLITLISLIIAIILIRYTVKLKSYLKGFVNISNKVSNGEFYLRLNNNAKGELGELTKNFNKMIETMDNTISEVEYKNIQLKSIIKSISHGILAIDINANILLINEKAKKMIKSNKDLVEGQSILSIIKEDKILKEIYKFIGSKKNETSIITTNEDIVYKIKQDPVYLQGGENILIGYIINIENITERVKLENMRSDFVANVTHELKTPITSISGFVETLRLNENIDTQTRNRFLNIIESESDRLKRLIDDILLLSFIEQKDNMIYENVNLYEVFKEVYEMIFNNAKLKNIEIEYKFEDINLISNKDYIKQIFLNLIDNAIKYTNEYGQIWVNVFNEDENVVIIVKDNGIGISKEDTYRVFERFFRVDKSRSKEGTGLGLAIIKHIVKSLGGNIKLQSEVGVGSEFKVILPRR
jgi:two-component system phosphate regulon sensor histidine kinase PhoR